MAINICAFGAPRWSVFSVAFKNFSSAPAGAEEDNMAANRLPGVCFLAILLLDFRYQAEVDHVSERQAELAFGLALELVDEDSALLGLIGS